jgi:hypothetical protein
LALLETSIDRKEVDILRSTHLKPIGNAVKANLTELPLGNRITERVSLSKAHAVYRSSLRDLNAADHRKVRNRRETIPGIAQQGRSPSTIN